MYWFLVFSFLLIDLHIFMREFYFIKELSFSLVVRLLYFQVKCIAFGHSSNMVPTLMLKTSKKGHQFSIQLPIIQVINSNSFMHKIFITETDISEPYPNRYFLLKKYNSFFIIKISPTVPSNYTSSSWRISYIVSGHTTRVLTELGAIVNVADESNETPLHLAALLDHKYIVQALFELGANLDAENDDKKTARQLAVENSKFTIPYEIDSY